MMLIQFTGKELLAFGRSLPATCVVRNEMNGWRKPDQVVYTKGQTTPHGVAYYPRRFPAGTWELIRVVDMPKNTEYWPVYIDTNATQTIRAWEVEEGKYVRPKYQWIRGKGYGIHHARYKKGDDMVKSNTTLGCINILSPDDALWLGKEVREAMGMRQRVFIKVPPWNKWR